MISVFSYFELLVLVVTVISLIVGLCKGFISQLFRLIGRIGSIIVAIIFCDNLGGFLNKSITFVADKVGETFAYWIWCAVSLLFVWLVLAIIIGFIGKWLTNLIDVPVLGFINRLLGGILAVAVIYVIVSVVIAAVGLIPADSTGVLANVKQWLDDQIFNGCYMRFFAENNWFGDWVVGLIK